MRVIFLRHGESTGDLEKQFGGWSDPYPTKKGLDLARKVANKFTTDFPEIRTIYTSPLRRASEFAEVIGEILDLKVEELVYLKERNTYGLLNGLEHDKAKLNYPEIYERYVNQEYIPGSEKYDDFMERLEMLLKFLEKNHENDMGIALCITQGYLMTTLIEEFAGKLRDSIAHGSYFECEIDKGQLKLLSYSGITFLNDFEEEQMMKEDLKKFKE